MCSGRRDCWSWIGRRLTASCSGPLSGVWRGAAWKPCVTWGWMKRALEKGQSYVSVMTDLDGSRVLEVVEDRTEEAADKLWKSLFTASVGF
jgi:hypothetical protein